VSVFTSLESVAALIGDTPHPHARPLIVGIVGAPGAGKSTISAELLSHVSASALLPMDGFHLSQSRLRELGRRERMGAPDTFDVDAFAATLQELRAGQGVVRAPWFDRTIEEPVASGVEIHPTESTVIVVEGNYLLLEREGWHTIAPLLDLSFFIELDRDIRIERLIARHEHFGKTAAAATAWALGPDEVNAVLVEATASRADHRIRLPHFPTRLTSLRC
jgi:pantothenate kinase